MVGSTTDIAPTHACIDRSAMFVYLPMQAETKIFLEIYASGCGNRVECELLMLVRDSSYA
jgi:hypothetical protein